MRAESSSPFGACTASLRKIDHDFDTGVKHNLTPVSLAGHLSVSGIWTETHQGKPGPHLLATGRYESRETRAESWHSANQIVILPAWNPGASRCSRNELIQRPGLGSSAQSPMPDDLSQAQYPQCAGTPSTPTAIRSFGPQQETLLQRQNRTTTI